LHNPMPGIWLFLLVGLAYAHHHRKQPLNVPLIVRVMAAVLLLAVFGWQTWAGLSSFHTRAGVHHIKKRNFEKADRALAKAVEFPNADTAMLKRCYVLGRIKKVDAAVDTCGALLARHPWHHIAHDQIARQYHRQRRMGKAEYHYAKAVEIYPRFPRAKKSLKALRKRKNAKGKK